MLSRLLPRILTSSSPTTRLISPLHTMALPKEQKVWVVANPNPKATSPDVFKLETRPLQASNDSVLVSVDYLSNDPVTRLISFNQKGNTPSAGGIGTVLADAGDWKKGDRITAQLPWTDYAAIPLSSVTGKAAELKGKPHASLSDLGTTAITAVAGLEVLDVQADDVVLVGGASGAVGSAFVQLAKHVRGAKRVVAVAGGPEKAAWVKKLGADAVVDYKSKSFKEDLAKALPDGATKFLDPVGGDTLDFGLQNMAAGGRVANCGNIAALNGGVQTLTHPLILVMKGLTVVGFSVRNYVPRYAEIQKQLAAWVEQGKISADGTDEVVEATVDSIPNAYLTLYDGSKKTGKSVTHIKH